MQLSTNKDKKQKQNNVFSLKLGWLKKKFIIEVRAFTVVVLKILVFNTSKSYFIYFTTSLYNTPNNKCSIFFLSLHFK